MTVFYYRVIATHMDKNDVSDDVPTADSQDTFETEFTSRPPSIAIVKAIATIEGCRPTDFDFSLFDSVDPDALDILFADSSDDEETTEDIVAEFCVDGYVVQIRTDGTITVKVRDSSE